MVKVLRYKERLLGIRTWPCLQVLNPIYNDRIFHSTLVGEVMCWRLPVLSMDRVFWDHVPLYWAVVGCSRHKNYKLLVHKHWNIISCFYLYIVVHSCHKRRRTQLNDALELPIINHHMNDRRWQPCTIFMILFTCCCF